jgi:hypothetical protein
MAKATDTHLATTSEADAAPPTDGNRIESHTLAAANSADARHALIAEAAYHRAKKRGFGAGEDWQDWFAAEREVDALLDRDL